MKMKNMLNKYQRIKDLKVNRLNKANLNLAGNIFINRLLKEKMIFQPYKIDLEPTTKCNLNCIFCQVPGWKRSRLTDLTFDNFKKIIYKFPLLKSIKLQGMGEPFLNPELLSMIDFCNKKDICTTIFNNGTVLNELTINELFKSPPDYLVFSLDTINRETYSIIRGKDMLEKVLKNIDLTVAEKHKNKSDTKIMIWSVLNKYNFAEIDQLVRLAKDLAVDRIVFQTKLTGFGKTELEKKNDCIAINLFEEEIGNIIGCAIRTAKEINQDIEIYKGDYYSPSKPCNAVRNSVYVTVEGEIVPCCIIADPGVISMGNIYNANSINDIWNNDRYRNLRKTIRENKLPHFCRNCYVGCSVR